MSDTDSTDGLIGLNDIARQLALVLQEHEHHEHQGQSCWDERVNAVAFLCHRLGVRSRYLIVDLISRLAEYERAHAHDQREKEEKGH